ncbi:MAG: right-handed parallel beta-helix repeat-containing protein [Planctomycetota bacterium]
MSALTTAARQSWYCNGPAIINSNIVGNRDNGIDLRDCNNPAIVNCSVVENKDHGINLRDCNSPTVANSIVVGSEDHGIKLRDCNSTTITNCTIVGNEEYGISGGDPTITNCIVWDNLSSAISGDGVATYSNIEGGWPGLGNIDADPCFVDPNNGDYHLKSEGWRWDSDAEQWAWDDVTSRCIDAGNPGSDLRDEAITLAVDPLNRFGRNLRINMGAHGGAAQASMPPYGWALLGDLTNDGTVDFVDLAHWTEGWLISRSDLPGDLDRNGIVDMLDFALLAQELFLETIWYE